mmetsp:Transcript_5393/g.13322  ORF Transcript_5393/g.13322 Transcript_5393/m.13322 type:complete len:256 (-) Transcript_5393:614-1381(-)
MVSCTAPGRTISTVGYSPYRTPRRCQPVSNKHSTIGQLQTNTKPSKWFGLFCVTHRAAHATAALRAAREKTPGSILEQQGTQSTHTTCRRWSTVQHKHVVDFTGIVSYTEQLGLGGTPITTAPSAQLTSCPPTTTHTHTTIRFKSIFVPCDLSSPPSQHTSQNSKPPGHCTTAHSSHMSHPMASSTANPQQPNIKTGRVQEAWTEESTVSWSTAQHLVGQDKTEEHDKQKSGYCSKKQTMAKWTFVTGHATADME